MDVDAPGVRQDDDGPTQDHEQDEDANMMPRKLKKLLYTGSAVLTI